MTPHEGWMGRFVIDCDDYEEDWPPYFERGDSYELSSERPKLKSVSEAAHRAYSMKAQERGPLGFHRPR